MTRVRLGVVLLVPPPLDREVDTLRKALGDGTLGRVPAHLTLVPPVNVREDRLSDARRVVREAGAATRAFTVSLGSPKSFLPDNPTLYLPITEGGEAVCELRDRVFREPLARPLSWRYVPHVTVADEIDPSRIGSAEAALAPYRAEVTFDRVHILRENPGRVWEPWAEATLATPAVVGRGGLPLELSTTDIIDPEGWALLQRQPFAITARREGKVVGVASGWTSAEEVRLETLFVRPVDRNQGIGAHLLAAVESLAAQRECTRLVGDAPAGSPGEHLLRTRGWLLRR